MKYEIIPFIFEDNPVRTVAIDEVLDYPSFEAVVAASRGKEAG